MYESLFKGRPDQPVPSGFYLKFSNSGWSPLFGSTGTKIVKKWSASSVVKQVAYLQGVVYDAQNEADCMEFWICDTLTSKPLPPPPPPVVCKAGFLKKNNVCVRIPIPRQCGCFNGPMAGKFRSGQTKKTTVKAKPWCKVKDIKSCNQGSKLANGPIWCSLTINYTNCASITVNSGECNKGQNLGKCTSDTVSGDMNEIWMYTNSYRGQAS